MNSKKLSIIIPIYNAELYLRECLNSVINQTYRNLEIILVNDGSKDKSEDICKEYCDKDSRVNYFWKTNSGVSATRNYGLERATGELVGFVDQDDTLELDMYEKMVASMSEDVDVVCCGVNRVNSEGKLLVKISSNQEKEYTATEAMRACLNRTLSAAVWSKIFRINLFNSQENPIRFPEGCGMEDYFVLPRVFRKSRKIIEIKEAKYNYFVRDTSVTSQIHNAWDFWIYKTIKEFDKYLDDWFPGIDKELKIWKITNCMNLYRSATLQKKNMDRVVFKRIQEEFNAIWLSGVIDKDIPFKKRIMLIETKCGLFLIRKRLRS